jgi:hypothetical protein
MGGAVEFLRQRQGVERRRVEGVGSGYITRDSCRGVRSSSRGAVALAVGLTFALSRSGVG